MAETQISKGEESRARQDDGEQITLTATSEEAGQRVDRFLAMRLPELTRTRLKALIESGCLSAEGAILTAPSYKVKAGQALAIFVPDPVAPEPEGQAIDLAIVYEDKDLIVIDKPAGMVVHPAPGNPDGTLVNALIAHCGDSLKGVGGVRRPGIVHRLDKGTSGLIVAAKTQAAHLGLTSQFLDRSIERAYEALVWGRPEPREGRIEGNIGRAPRSRKKMAVLRRGGKPAITQYRVLNSYGSAAVTRLSCRLLTGRTHQIRVHLSHRGHALLGDPLYGRTTSGRLGVLSEPARARLLALSRQALHAKSLGFHHPVTAVRLDFESSWPRDLKDLTDTLESM